MRHTPRQPLAVRRTLRSIAEGCKAASSSSPRQPQPSICTPEASRRLPRASHTWVLQPNSRPTYECRAAPVVQCMAGVVDATEHYSKAIPLCAPASPQAGFHPAAPPTPPPDPAGAFCLNAGLAAGLQQPPGWVVAWGPAPGQHAPAWQRETWRVSTS